MTLEVQATALLINGTVGSGGSTAADAVGLLLAEQDVPHAVIDLDALRRAWPAPAHDPFNNDLELENLRAVATTYRRAGAQRLVLAGVLEQPALRGRYSAAVAAPLTVVRLRAPVSTLLQRLRSRHGDDVAALDWHLARCGELHAILEGAGVDDAVVGQHRLGPATGRRGGGGGSRLVPMTDQLPGQVSLLDRLARGRWWRAGLVRALRRPSGRRR